MLKGDVDIDDGAGLEHLVGMRHAVAHHMVDRGVQRIGEAVLALARRARLEHIDDKGLGPVVDLQGADPGGDEAVEVGEHLA
ncbi:hypothetical protein D3C79_712540 [compost metagenome]